MSTPPLPPVSPAAPAPSRRRPLFPFAALCAAALALLFASGCLLPHRRQTQRSSSIVNYLYPRDTNPLPQPGLPTLRLPLRIGIAFVPSSGGDIPEVQKSNLLARVAAEFKGREYIESIEVVPTSYLRPGGGFDNLDQTRRLLNFDVVALVAFDQVQFTDQNVFSLAYWTIVGAYVFRGNRNDTQTLMETAVYDIPSRQLLFRAPGGSQVRANATAITSAQNLRADALKGFDDATTDLIANLKAHLEDFRTRLKSAPETVAKIEHKPGYTGGGSFEGSFAVALLALVGVAAWRRRS